MFDRYFGISLPRTGTVSLMQGMRRLGFTSKHYFSHEEFQGIRFYQFANDFPISIEYRKLDEIFPNAGFIYSDRDVDDWLTSYGIHLRRTKNVTFGNWRDYNIMTFGTVQFDRDMFRKMFLKHRAGVFEYFKGKDNFLVLDMPYGDDAWDRLCRFTGKRKPKGKFPHRNGSYSSTNPWCPPLEVRHG
jgi:hypothetical protein